MWKHLIAITLAALTLSGCIKDSQPKHLRKRSGAI